MHLNLRKLRLAVVQISSMYLFSFFTKSKCDAKAHFLRGHIQEIRYDVENLMRQEKVPSQFVH